MGVWEPLFFWIFAVGALVTSLLVLIFRNPLYSALSLIADFFCFAGLYVLLSAHFIAVTQVLVYGGAIMVLFVFIIMLLNLGEGELGRRQFSIHHILAFATGAAILAFSGLTVGAIVDQEEVSAERRQAVEEHQQADGDAPLRVATESRVDGLYADITEQSADEIYQDRLRDYMTGEASPADGKYTAFNPAAEFTMPPFLERELADDNIDTPKSARDDEQLFGTVEPLSILLVNRFVIPFELTAVLLLGAVIGAVIIAKKRL